MPRRGSIAAAMTEPAAAASAGVGSPLRRAAPADWVARLVVVAAFTIVAYLPSLNAPFVFDDLPNILLNERVQPDSVAGLTDALDARGARDRPLPMLTFAVNYLQGGHDPLPYHVTNLLIHVLNAFLVFAVVAALARAPNAGPRERLPATELAFAAALLWAVHPVNTQAVTYIVQRMASMAALFYLLGVLLFVLWRLGRMRGRVAVPLLVASYVAAVSSKANAATLPAVLLLLDVAFFTPWRRYHTWLVAGVAGLGIVLAAWYAREAFAHFLVAPSHRDFSGLERLMTQGRVIWHYVSLLIWPAADRLQLDYEFTISRSLLQPATTAIAWVALVASAGVALAWLRRHPWPAAAWLVFLVALSVESSFLLLELVFEHRVYLPAVLLGAGLLAPLYLRAGTQAWRTGLTLAVLALAGAFTWQTVERNTQWADFGGFWVGDLERGASPARVTVNGAARYLRQGRPEQALALLRRSDQETPKLNQARGEALMALGRHDEAIEAFRAVLEERPRWTRTAYYTGLTMVEAGRLEEARGLLEQIENLHPESLYADALAANIHQAAGRPDQAAARLERTLAQGRHSMQEQIFLHLQLANVYLALERPDAARGQYREVVERNPQQWVAWAKLHQLLEAGGSTEEAAAIERYMDRYGVEPANFR